MFELVRYEKSGRKKGFDYTSLGSQKKKVIIYDKIGYKARRKDVCMVCEKERIRTNLYIQEVSPDNTHPDGVPKSRECILKEEQRKATDFASHPFLCKSCE